MKIPKRIETLLNRREHYAWQLQAIETELCDWLSKQGIDLGHPDIQDAVLSGCLIYCEPSVARDVVTKYLEEYEK